MWLEDTGFTIEYHINSDDVKYLLKGKTLVADSSDKYVGYLELGKNTNSIQITSSKNDLHVVLDPNKFKNYISMTGNMPQGSVIMNKKLRTVFVHYHLNSDEINDAFEFTM